MPYFYFAPAAPIGSTHFDLSNKTSLAKVSILYGHQDADPAIVNATYSSGADGIVFAGSGAGGMPEKVSKAAAALFNETGIPIVASHRSADGFVPSSTKGYTIASGFLNPQKARIMLQLALTMEYSYDEIKKVFALGYPMP